MDQNQTLHYNMPSTFKGVAFTIAFEYGHMDDGAESAGIGHVAEHVLVAQIRKTIKPKEIQGYVSDNKLAIRLILSKDEYADPQTLEKQIFECIKKIDREIFENEKNRILLELEEMEGSAFRRLSASVFEAIIESPPELRRSRNLDAGSVEKMTFENMQDAVLEIASRRRMAFVGFAGNDDTYQETVVAPFRYPAKVTFARSGRILIKNTALSSKKTKSLILAFRSLSLENELQDRLALGFAQEEIYWQFQEDLEHFGVYSMEHQYLIGKGYGILWFGTYARTGIHSMHDIFLESLHKFLSSADLDGRLAAYREERIDELKAQWADGHERTEWIVDDVLDFGRVLDLECVVSAVSSVSSEKVRETCESVLLGNQPYVLESSDEPLTNSGRLVI